MRPIHRCRVKLCFMTERDLQFVFHLGDVSQRLSFEIDEALDIMGDYATYGKVVLKLDCREADNLWCKLNGYNAVSLCDFGSPQARERYLFLFNTMSIDSLLVVDGSRTLQFSRGGVDHPY